MESSKSSCGSDPPIPIEKDDDDKEEEEEEEEGKGGKEEKEEEEKEEEDGRSSPSMATVDNRELVAGACKDDEAVSRDGDDEVTPY